VQRDCLSWEKELLGLYLSAHPFEEYANRLNHFCTPLNQVADKGRDMKRKKEKAIRVAGMVTSAKKIATKANEPMVFLRLEDLTGNIEVVVFPRAYKEKPEVWEGEKVLVVSGRPQEKDGDWKVLAETAYEVTPDNIDLIEESTRGGVMSVVEEESDALKKDLAVAGSPTKQIHAVTLTLRAQLPETILLTLRGILDKYPGQYNVYFAIENPGGRQKILSSYRIAFNDLIAKEVEGILGADTVKAEV
jgi:DNA polymerase-3 subunit alpha